MTMKIKEVSVSVHEKRNHPHEYGHYDCEVRLTAEVQPDESHDYAIPLLRAIARVHVKEECDNWEEGVVDRREERENVSMAEYHVEQVERGWARSKFQSAKQALTFIAKIRDRGTAGDLKKRLRKAMNRKDAHNPRAEASDLSDDKIPF